MKNSKFILWLVLLLAATAGSAWARDRHHHHHRSHLGVYIGVPFAYSYSYPYPWYAPPPYYYYPPPVVVRREPQVYIERAAPQPAPQTQNYWYYCTNPPGYYPYVKDCPGGWLHVVPTPQN